MRTLRLPPPTPFRLALAFSIVMTGVVATAFALVYFGATQENFLRVSAVLQDESEKSAGDDVSALRAALQLRLTRDIRRLDYVALFDAAGQKIFGNVAALPDVPVDGRAHRVEETPGGREPALFVARRRPDGGVLLLGRNLREIYELQATILRTLAIALIPTVLASFAVAALFTRRASRRLRRLQDAIAKVIRGEFSSRLPVRSVQDDIDKVAADVNVMLDEIARLVDQLRSVGGAIAHDLRSPLTVARSKLETVIESGEITGEALTKILAANLQLERAAITIGAILRISAVEHGAKEKRFREVDLVDIAEDLYQFYVPVADSRSIAMRRHLSPTPLQGDADLLREAVSNLIDNALKFTPEGGRIAIECRLDQGSPFLAVIDNGLGVPLEDRTRIFQRFFRGRNGETAPGHGLGLNIARTIFQLHGLDLVLEDNAPGSRFVVRAVTKARQ